MAIATKTGLFRLHLSTFLILILAAGALLAFHMQPNIQRINGVGESIEYIRFGFPFVYRENFQMHSSGNESIYNNGSASMYNPALFLINFAVVLIPLAGLCEWWTAWRIARKEMRQEVMRRIHFVPLVMALAVSILIISLNVVWSFRFGGKGGSPHITWMALKQGWPQPSFVVVTGVLESGTLHFYRGDDESAAMPVTHERNISGISLLELASRAKTNLSSDWENWLRNLAANILLIMAVYVVAEYLWSVYEPARPKSVLARRACPQAIRV